MGAEDNIGKLTGKQTEEKPTARYVELSFDGRFKKSAASVFRDGMFRPSVQSLLEFTDNAVASRSSENGQTTQVFVNVSEDRLSVLGAREAGMDDHGIQTMLQAGKTTGVGVSTMGVGAKFAAWTWGDRFTVVAKKPGQSTEWCFDEPGFGDGNVSYSGTRRLDSRVAEDPEIGRVEVIVRGLNDEVKKDLPGGAELKRVLGEVYRPLLTRNQVKFDRSSNPKIDGRETVNAEGKVVTKQDTVAMWAITNKKAQQVHPLEIPLKPGYSEKLKVLEVEIEVDGSPKIAPVGFWAGEKDPSQDGANLVDPGIRVYYDGRLIKRREPLDFDLRNPNLSTLVGEVHLDHVTGIKESGLFMNKSQGIAANSPQWIKVRNALKEAIAPLVDQLLQRPQEPSQVLLAGLTQVLNGARLAADKVLRELSDEDPLVAQILSQGTLGIDKAQEPPKKNQESTQKGEPPAGIQGTQWKNQTGRTFPSREATPDIRRIRRGLVHRIDLKMFDEGDLRISTIVEEGRGDSKKRVLMINMAHPDVQRVLRDADTNVSRARFELKELTAQQMVHQAALEYGRLSGESDISTYERIHDKLRHSVGVSLLNDPEAQALRIADAARQQAKANGDKSKGK